jgi:hypothetical protein
MLNRREFVSAVSAASFVANPVLSRILNAQTNNTGIRKLIKSLEAIRMKLEWPGLDIATSAKNLKTADAALDFVKNKILFVDYPGSVNGAEGVLRTRVGNSTDKAFLLRALLTELGHRNISLSKAVWPKNQTPHQVSIQPEKTSQDEKPHPWFQQISDEVTRSVNVAEKILDQNNIQLKSRETEINSTSEWVWVEAEINGRRTILDPVFPDLERPAELQKNYEPAPVDITISIDAIGKNGKPSTIMRWKLPLQEVIGFDAILSFVPFDEKYKKSRKGMNPTNINEWMVCIVIGNKIGQSTRFRPQGKTAKSVAPKKSGGLFGGALGGGGSSSKSESFEATSLCLRMEMKHSNGQITKVNRIFQNLAKGFDAYELMSTHQIGIMTAGVPQLPALARHTDEFLDMAKIKAGLTGNNSVIKPGFMRGLSSRSAAIINAIISAQVSTSRKDLQIQWNGPSIFMESTQLGKRGEKFIRKRRMDILNHNFIPSKNATIRDRLTWGIATCAAEASLFKTESLNQSLITVADSLSVSQKVTSFPGPDNILSTVVKDGGYLIQSPQVPELTWAIWPDGNLSGIYSQANSPVQAKAVTTEDLTGVFVGGTMSAVVPPAAFLAVGLSAYFVELGRAYLKAAVVMEGIGSLIAGEPLPVGYYATLEGIQNMPRDLMNELLRGLARGYIDSLLGLGIGHYTPGGRVPGGFTDKVKDFGIGGTTSVMNLQTQLIETGEKFAKEILR